MSENTLLETESIRGLAQCIPPHSQPRALRHTLLTNIMSLYNSSARRELGPITRFCAKEHRARVDGRATARHLHCKIERAVRCHTVKVSAESAGAVSRATCSLSLCTLTTRQSGRLTQPDGGAGTPAGRGCHLQGTVGTNIVDHSVKVGASHTP